MSVETATNVGQISAETLSKVCFGMERVLVKRDSTPLAVLVPVEDAEKLKRIDFEQLDKALLNADINKWLDEATAAIEAER